MSVTAESSPRVQAILRAHAPRLATLITPALVFELDAVTHNIRAMAEFAGPDRWRPHVKTHKHPAIVRALLTEGVTAFKCATQDELDMQQGPQPGLPAAGLCRHRSPNAPSHHGE